MAKVAIFSESLTPSVIELAHALGQQQQDVVLFTSRSQISTAPTDLQIRFAFHRWSALEALKLVPSLLSENFDVWHFLFSSSDQRPRMAHWILAGLARGVPHKVVAASFTHLKSLSGLRNEKFLSLLDLVLFPDRPLLMQMKRRQAIRPHTLAEVMPPLQWSRGQDQITQIRDELRNLIRHARPFVLLPDLTDSPDWSPQSPLNFVVLKSVPRRAGANPKVFYTGDLFQRELEELLDSAKALCLLYGDYSVLELQRFHSWSERHKLPLIVHRHQTELWPGLCWNSRSGWVLDPSADPLQKLLVENPSLSLHKDFENYPRHEVVDSTLNELLRLYQKSFSLRWT